jgi:hypothetical protein
MKPSPEVEAAIEEALVRMATEIHNDPRRSSIWWREQLRPHVAALASTVEASARLDERRKVLRDIANMLATKGRGELGGTLHGAYYVAASKDVRALLPSEPQQKEGA